jgi:cell division protein FtsB
LSAAKARRHPLEDSQMRSLCEPEFCVALLAVSLPYFGYTASMRAKYWRQGFLICALLLASFWLLYLIWGLAGKAQIAVTQANDEKWQYQALEERKAMLQANVAALQTDRGRDAAIRTSFGVARPGEEVIVVVPPLPATTTPPLTWWQIILSWF